MTKPVTYEAAGVSIREADKLVAHLRAGNKLIGGFSGLFPLRTRGMKRPMLAASTDGVGTKLLVAQMSRKLATIGIDLVAMVVNDLIVCGAQPLFFLDYFATGRLNAREAKTILRGVIKGCEIAGMPLLGGETAEMPGLYKPEEFDLAGFGVGIVDGAKIIDGRRIKPGDLVFGFESSGLHSNGYSLARRVLLESSGLRADVRMKELGESLMSAMLRPTKIYVKLASCLRKARADIKGFAHITGGGIPGNLCRVLPRGADAFVFKNRWETPPIFKLIQRLGPVDYGEMLRTFNMGIGFMAVAAPGEHARIMRAALAAGERALVVGEIVKGCGKTMVEL
ncbi:MAG: phosphoribosylformylglycinamidine cyclo-ligase [bacterium]|nr:phosphoribosylformylglycinamidine cyclo-ligase [Candidatus Sumerlaeota bacterium]